MAPMLRLVSGFSPELAQLRARRLSSSCSQVPVPWNVVGAGLGEHGDGGAPGHPLLGVEAGGRHADRVHRVRRRHVDRVVGQPDVDVGGAVEPRVVVVAGGAVDVRGEGPRGGVRDRVLEAGRRRPGHEVEQALVVPVVPEGQARDLLAIELGVDVAGVGLEQGHLGLDVDDLREGADLERDVDAGDRGRRDRHRVLDVLLETGQGDPHPVGPGLHVDEAVDALGVGGGLPREVRVRVDEGDGGAGHAGAGCCRSRCRPRSRRGSGRRSARRAPRAPPPRGARAAAAASDDDQGGISWLNSLPNVVRPGPPCGEAHGPSACSWNLRLSGI